MYDGKLTSSPKMAEYVSEAAPFIVASSNALGALTLQLIIQSYSLSGINASISCVNTPSQYLNIAKRPHYFYYDGAIDNRFSEATNMIDIYSNIAWSFTSLPSWLNLTSISGSGSAALQILPNTFGGYNLSREYTLTVLGNGIEKTIDVNQSSFLNLDFPNNYDLDIVLSETGAVATLPVLASGFYSWNITSTLPGLNISATTGTGKTVVSVSSAINSGKPRNHTLRFDYPNGTRYVQVYQLGNVSETHKLSSIAGVNTTITACSGTPKFFNLNFAYH